MRLLKTCLALIVSATIATTASAQGAYDPVVTVNGDAITAFELRQRATMLKIFRTPGDLNAVAREQLIDDRLKQQEMGRAGLVITDEGLRTEMANFASRANLDLDQFVRLLEQNGVSEETFRDFVRIGATWRSYIRDKYRRQVQISDRDVDQALGTSQGGSKIEVLLSEIIIPAPPQRAASATAEAERIARMTSTSAFESAARRVSALPSRARGGRLGWLPITNYPAPIRAILLDLSKGQVTAPIPIPNGIALFQMRGVREVKQPRPSASEIEYLTFTVPGGASDAARSEASRIMDRVDTCDDFYGIARGLPATRLQRQTVAPAQIPSDVAQVLAGLDRNEVSYGLLRNNGQDLLMVMMCNRTYGASADVDRDAVRNQLLGQRLEGYANALIAQLRARATIR